MNMKSKQKGKKTTLIVAIACVLLAACQIKIRTGEDSSVNYAGLQLLKC